MPWHAGVVGSPIAHSMSPVLHRAAYRALGLETWSYHRDQVEAGLLHGHVEGLSAQWRGLSVTMPLKEEALALAHEVGAEAELVGGANTLTRCEGGWRADNTDVHGLEQALRGAGVEQALRGAGVEQALRGAGVEQALGGPHHEPSAVIVGSGATARSALVALSAFGVQSVRFVVRDSLRPGMAELALRLGITTSTATYADPPATWGQPGVVVSTVPSGATPPVDKWELPEGAVVFDVVYAGWPTPWSQAWASKGVDVVRGDGMLLHQAVRQVELMTGEHAPVEAMTIALADALDRTADDTADNTGGTGR